METEAITAILSNVGKTFQRINAPMLRKFLKLQESLTGNLIGASLKTFTNTKVRQGEQVKNPKKHALDYATHVQKHFDKMISKVKTPAAKEKYKKQQQEYVREFTKVPKIKASTTKATTELQKNYKRAKKTPKIYNENIQKYYKKGYKLSHKSH